MDTRMLRHQSYLFSIVITLPTIQNPKNLQHTPVAL